MIPCLLPKRSATRFSNAATFGPICVEVRKTRSTAAISSSPWTAFP